MPFFAQEIFEQANAKGPLSDKAYLDARDKARRLAGPEGIDAALKKHGLDALVAPAMSPAWPFRTHAAFAGREPHRHRTAVGRKGRRLHGADR